MHDVILLLTSWPAYSLVAVGVIALWLMQSAFSSAPLHASLPGVTAAEPVAGIVLGVVAFREKVPASPLLIAVQVAGLIMLVAGVILVARSPTLSGLQKYHVPGERLLHRDREQRRHRPPAAARQVPPGLAGPDPGLPGPGESRSRQLRTRQRGTGQLRTRRTGQLRTGQLRTGQLRIRHQKSGHAKPGQPKSGQSGPGHPARLITVLLLNVTEQLHSASWCHALSSRR